MYMRKLYIRSFYPFIMDVITKEEFERNKEKYFSLIKEGSVFIYPTDTIYGIRCSALDSDAIKRVRELKGRLNIPFSVIAPSRRWISENCITDGDAKDWIDKLPGPYTLILKMKNSSAVSKEVNPKNGTIGVRLPKHWIYQYFAELGIPIITTSANKTGKDFMTKIENLDSDIKLKTEFIIYEGVKFGTPSTIISLDNEEPEIIER